MDNKNKNKTDNSNTPLFQPIKMGSFEFKNRIAMAALTRCRADPKTQIPNELHVKYYSERSEEAAFVLTECTAVSPIGNSFPGACGIYNKEQVEGWKKVLKECHKKESKVFIQIWHAGRANFELFTGGEKPLGPSAIANRHKFKTPMGTLEYPLPKEMTEEDIDLVVEQFKQGAINAKEAGFDGIQLHGANGYLIDQFLRDASNQRKDKYGGSIENRCRLPLRVIDVLVDVFGSDKVGIKISPGGRFNDMWDSNPTALFTYFLNELEKRKIAFVEVSQPPEFRKVENYYKNKGEEEYPDIFETYRKIWKGVLVANSGLDFKTGNEVLEKKNADMVTYGRWFISNPDLVNRFRNGYELTPYDWDTFYVPGEKGYTSYTKYGEDKK